MARQPGRPMGATNRRFQVIPRSFHGGCVYAAELSNGVVKVGFSRNPRTRMDMLAGQVRRRFGAQVVGFHIGPDMPARSAMASECRLIRRFAELGTAVRGTHEFFHHITFAQAVTLVRQMTRQPLGA